MEQDSGGRGEVGETLKEELSACQHFLVDTGLEIGRYKVLNFQMSSKLDTKLINEKLEEVFNQLDFAAKISIALGFVLQNFETGEY